MTLTGCCRRLVPPALLLAVSLPAPLLAAELAELPEGELEPVVVAASQDGVPVRSEPGFLYRELRQLTRGEEVVVDARQGSWLKLRDEGWVFLDHVELPGPAAVPLQVSTAGVRLRAGPGTDHEIVDKLGAGVVVEGVESRDGWWRLARGGWVHGSLVERIAPATPGGAPETAAMRVVPASVNVRSQPSTEGEILRRAERDERLGVRRVVDGWAELDEGGWIRADLLSATGPAAPAPERAQDEAVSFPVDELRRWSYMDLHGMLFEIAEFRERAPFVLALRQSMNETGLLETDWTYLKLAISVPPGAYRFHYAPNTNKTTITDASGQQYGNVYVEGPVDRLPAHLRQFFVPQVIHPGERFEGVLLFRPTLETSDITEVAMQIEGRKHRFFESP